MYPALASVLTTLAALPMQFGGMLQTPLGQAFVVVIAIAAVVLIGRLVLRVAWRLVTIAAVVIGLLLLFSFFGLGI
ncbi:hypothetical protein C499_02878 [Halogeometricum borinquense DSM 11551]|uniref:Uncharacterized protein n=2 Tax=Halogeometricum borinquense TaxID=60847 RepID=E4NQA4_HALBP|nr:hypothetical protein [Halogeometricum borinquense]ADQ66666.1 hypothetical protein Hbor_10750 [Halogeometricum borinquense DSM 11551]ELY30175.1 hypothetical protein C499_02878 [Halogeometricum borinquense DSM 11551]RYJ14513.1 hypothetical protein ELS19_11485 [Halogeometricum borinquense]